MVVASFEARIARMSVLAVAGRCMSLVLGAQCMPPERDALGLEPIFAALGAMGDYWQRLAASGVRVVRARTHMREIVRLCVT